MKRYIINICKGPQTYTYGREWSEEERRAAFDTLAVLLKFRMIDEFNIKEVNRFEVKNT